jgi:hypothetical protein
LLFKPFVAKATAANSPQEDGERLGQASSPTKDAIAFDLAAVIVTG